MFIVTNGDTGPIAVYRVPRNIRAGGTAPLERVGQPFTPAKADLDPGSRVAFVIDGKEIATVTVARDGTAEFEDDIEMDSASAGQPR